VPWADVRPQVLAAGPVGQLLVQLPAGAVVCTWGFPRTGGSRLPAIALHASLSLFVVPAPDRDADWRPCLVSVGLGVAVAAVLVGTGRLRDARMR
jgi:hypothetical protein